MDYIKLVMPEEVDYLKTLQSVIEDLQRAAQPLATVMAHPANDKNRLEAKRFLRSASNKIAEVMAQLKN